MGTSLLIFVLGLTAGGLAALFYRLARERASLRILTEFTSSVSHELRTPLAQILLFAETLEMDRARSEHGRQEAVRIIAQEARHLSHVVENVLLFSRAERKMLSIETELVSLTPALRSVLEIFAPIADAQAVNVRSLLTDGVLVPLHRGALQQIMLNLLENAVKYGPPGQTVVVRSELNSGSVRLIVDDEGPGIAPADRDRVWEPFVRLTGNGNAPSGSGIGLSVVRELVTAHRGRAWIESARANGTRVVVELPGAILESLITPVYPLLDVTR